MKDTKIMLKIYSSWWNRQEKPNLQQRIMEHRKNKKDLQNQALAKKQGYDSARGTDKGIIGGEIERIFREIDRIDYLLTLIYQSNFQGNKVQFTLEQLLKV